MIQSVYMIVIPGADRVYVSGNYPESYVATQPGSRVFRADFLAATRLSRNL
jgi:hypothetical protein